MLSVRNVKNILDKKGISIAPSNIHDRLKNGKPIFSVKKRQIYKWKSRYRSLREIAEMEGVKYSQLGSRVHKNKESVKVALKSCRDYDEPLYEFEGKMLYPKEICTILSDRSGISFKIMINRFYMWDFDIEKMIKLKSDNIHAPYEKEIIVIKEGLKAKFVSIKEAMNILKIPSSTISVSASGRGKGKQLQGCRGYYFNYSKETDEDTPHYIGSELSKTFNVDEEISRYSKQKIKPHTFNTAVIVDGEILEKQCTVCEELKSIKQYEKGRNKCKKCRSKERKQIYKKRKL